MNEADAGFQLTDEHVARLPQAAELYRFQRKLATKMATMLDVPERRRHVRFPFKTEQLLAFCDGENPPGLHDFKAVRCRDISESGFSFYAAEPPDCKFVVVGIRLGEELSWLKARVVHDLLGVFEGERQYLVGCEFTEKLKPASLK